MSKNNGHTSLRLKTGLAEMLKGGVIMDVTDARQAEIARRRSRLEEARVPVRQGWRADVRLRCEW